MTWLEKYEESLKTPAIGAEEWFRCIPIGQAEEAHRLIVSKVPVCVQPQPGAGNPFFLVLFDGTEFIAGGFDERSSAETFAGNWNAKL